MYLTEQDIERFWAGVDRTGGPDACWPWKGANGRNVYRQFWLNGANVPGHTVALALDGRPVRAGFWGLHTCDFKPCQNPAHLYEGTERQNTQDAWDRGRNKGNSKLTREQVSEIEHLLATTSLTLKAIGKLYKIDKKVVSWIRDGIHQYSKKASGE